MASQFLECLCVKKFVQPLEGVGSTVEAFVNVEANTFATLDASASISASATRARCAEATLAATASISAKLSADTNIPAGLTGVGDITPGMTADYSIKQKIDGQANLSPTYLDKFFGDFGDSECTQKLYPTSDITIESGYAGFASPSGTEVDLYTYIDEGVFVGDYDEQFGNSMLMSDDKDSYITPKSTTTVGLFQYKCGLSNFIIKPEETRLRMRISAPLYNEEAVLPPVYLFKDIKFEDPASGLIVQYEDFSFRGDANHETDDYVNWTTVSVKALTNKVVDLYEWQDGYPDLHQGSGYTLSFVIDVENIDDAFDEGYDPGYQEDFIREGSAFQPGAYQSRLYSPRVFHDFNPVRQVKISAVEICNDGGKGPSPENYINIYAEVEEFGRRLEREIKPVYMPPADFDTGIYPEGSTTVWDYNGLPEHSNLTASGAKAIVGALKDDHTGTFAKLRTTEPHLDSGRLTLKFSHRNSFVDEVVPGAFNFGFDESPNGICRQPKGAFDTENKNGLGYDDGFFVVDCLYLKVVAKKEVGSRDYALDVVGYSDDKLLNVTSAVGGFLQNPSGDIGSWIASSGFLGSEDLGISTNTTSEKDSYFETTPNNSGEDHYALALSPLVTGVEFETYEVPLKVFDDNVSLGQSRDYSMSTLFEHLYLDIYPIPSGASIAEISLVVRYAPQNALNLCVDGGSPTHERIRGGRSEGQFYPTSRQINDEVLNASGTPIGGVPLSQITQIPNAYKSPEDIKSNYTRKWRGKSGIVQGPFDPDMFSFSFENPLVEHPFLNGYFDMTASGDAIVSDVLVASGGITPEVPVYSGALIGSPSTYNSKGWRFKEERVFLSELPLNNVQPYTTIDFTATAGAGGVDFTGHPLSGQILDSFTNAVKVSGSAEHIKFTLEDSGTLRKDGAVFVRFSPNIDPALFQGGVIYSKENTAGDPSWMLSYDAGFLKATVKDGLSTTSVTDSVSYDEYSYPLSVLVTIENNTLKLYADNEIASGVWDIKRGEASIEDNPPYGDASGLYIGYAPTQSKEGYFFVTDFGISHTCNLLETDPDLTNKEVSVERFFDGIRNAYLPSGTIDRYKMWDFVDESTTDWNIGAFQYCPFSVAFNQIQEREGRDLILFDLRSDGLSYADDPEIAKVMPESVGSGIAYHTQIENDFLRMHLSDTPDNFYSIGRRITKNLPRGYIFGDKALVAETIIEHQYESSGNQAVSPQVIVSLYTRNQEPYYTPVEDNWGLITRKVHTIEGSGCFTRLDSVFTYEDLCDDSQQWSLFPSEPKLKEFKEKYFSKDVDDMFIQYDLSYPAGSGFRSKLKLHSTHVRSEDFWVTPTANSGIMNLTVSGNFPVNEPLNLFLENYIPKDSGEIPLYLLGPQQIEDSGLALFMLGASNTDPVTMSLFTVGPLGVGSGIPLYIEGSGMSSSGTMSLYTNGLGVDSGILPMVAWNSDTLGSSNASFDLFTYGSTAGSSGTYKNIPLYIEQEYTQGLIGASGQFPLSILPSPRLVERYQGGLFNLTIIAPDESKTLAEQVGLMTVSDPVSASGDLNLYLTNYGGTGSLFALWFNNNYGKDIDLEDNQYASYDSDNEIRGVTTVGYGSCTGNSPQKAIDFEIKTDECVWREEGCVEGGIFRAFNTYTNEAVGWSGNYYGIRKYDSLVPNTAYSGEMKIVTGNTGPIDVPRNFEEWEYGNCGPDWYFPALDASGCCTADCDQNLNHSGVKLVGHYPYLSGDASIDPLNTRMPSGLFGQAVKVNKDLMAISSPRFSGVYDEAGLSILDAGIISLYRRQPDVAGKKAAWHKEQTVTLPSGYRRDYISRTIENYITYPNSDNPEFSISARKWDIGQEGREVGSSLDIANSGDRQVVVAGAPGAQWTRTFDNIVESGIPICMLVFTDKFDPDADLGNLKLAADKYRILYRYFSAHWNDGGSPEFQPKLDLKVLVAQPSFVADTPPFSPEIDNDWIKHTYIQRLDDVDITDSQAVITNRMYSGIWDLYDSAFPTGNIGGAAFTPHSGIAPILGVYFEKSNSTNNGEAYLPGANKFIAEFEDFARASGVIDQTTIDTEARSPYVNYAEGESFDWVTVSVDLIEDTLATGNLIANDALEVITTGVGQSFANPDSYDVNIPPSSGGRVYIFEQESGVFNFVQELRSPVDRNRTDYNLAPIGSLFNDRYGHAVSISKDANVLAVGSPFTYIPLEVYERDDSENARMYNSLRSWLVSESMTAEVARYDDLKSTIGEVEAQKAVYNELSQSGKFHLRSDEDFWGDDNYIQLYKEKFNYKYRDVPAVGTWGFLYNAFAPISRLGYDVALDDDGSTLAAGAPTDSLNVFDDINVWGRSIYNSWASYVNAGAVRIFDSREYYPHNKAVEYYRLGNLDKSAHPTEDALGLYDQMGDYLSPIDVPFERLPFAQIDIPQDAGLAFIVTPELEPSDEIIENIKEWLDLGDRTLVLVGNDPHWEENGLYRNSNKIVNDILNRLGSRMRIHPAATQEEALIDVVSETDVENDLYNITKCLQPANNHNRQVSSPIDIARENSFAYGVGDIRIDLSKDGLESLFIKDSSPCPEALPCSPPLRHEGDLRSQWGGACTTDNGTPVKYSYNWPLLFGNDGPDEANKDHTKCLQWPENPSPVINKPNEDIVPVLAAAENPSPIIITIPGICGTQTIKTPVFNYETVETNTTIEVFERTHVEYVQFSIEEDENSDLTGQQDGFDSFDYSGSFFDPDTFQDRDAFIQATGVSQTQIREKERVVTEEASLVVSEIFEETDSEVIIMANVLAESRWSLGYLRSSDLTFDPKNKDQNLIFLSSIAQRSCTLAGDVAQLGGWTGRTSFEDAYSDSRLVQALSSFGHTPVENVDTLVLGGSNPYNVAWIAAPNGKPSASEINNLKYWLNTGGKKLVITYYADQEIADNVNYICEELGLSSKPLFSYSEGLYKVASQERYFLLGKSNDTTCDETLCNPFPQVLNGDHPIIGGCAGPYDYTTAATSTLVEKVSFFDSRSDWLETATGPDYRDFIPIKPGGNHTKIIYYDADIYETYYENDTVYRIRSEGNVEFPTLPESGYRIFFEWVTETPQEKYDFDAVFDLNEIQLLPYEDDPTGVPNNPFIEINETARYTKKTGYRDIKAVGDSINIDLDTSKWNSAAGFQVLDGSIPATPRLLTISGCPLPKSEHTFTESTQRRIPPYWEYEEVNWCNPDETIVISRGGLRPIKHPSSRYDCCLEDGILEVEDGPVVVAEEFANFSQFNKGQNKSKIVVIADSTMIQGQYGYYRNDQEGENQRFIRSLYPTSPDVPAAGKQYTFTQKLRSPEAGSPCKYYSVSGVGGGMEGLADNFNNLISVPSISQSDLYDGEDLIDPAFVTREATPKADQWQTLIEDWRQNEIIDKYRLFPRMSGVEFNSLNLTDATPRGNPINELLRASGRDFLDISIHPTGYKGDLFGYSISLSNEKLIVGAPGGGYHSEFGGNSSGCIEWDTIKADNFGSGLQLGQEGGAGSAYYFEKTGKGERHFVNNDTPQTFLDWEFVKKVKPSGGEVKAYISAGVGASGQRADRYGHSVSIDSDMLVVGAPYHGYATYYVDIYDRPAESLDGSFLRKDFNAEFDIPIRLKFDNGSVDGYLDSGSFVPNNGAAFTWRHEVQSYSTLEKDWEFVEKLNSVGHEDRYVNLGSLGTRDTVDDNFGTSVSIFRQPDCGRGDSDYTLVVGAPLHDFAASGNPVSGVEYEDKAGSAYTFDAMLRGQTPNFPSANSWIDIEVFGDGRSAGNKIGQKVFQNTTGDPQEFFVSGIITTNDDGAFILEGSGFDQSSVGFTSQRPYVEYVRFTHLTAPFVSDSINLFTSGTPLSSSGNMNLSLLGADSAFVYNNIGLNVNSYYLASGGLPDLPFSLYASGSDNPFRNLPLYIEGNREVENLNLRVRGK